MIKEFEYTFSGFGNCFSKCFLRLVHEENGPFVIVCSQMDKAVGTSVCNAHEIIRDGLGQKLQSDSRAEFIDQFRASLSDQSNLLVATVTFLSKALSDFFRGNRSWHRKLSSAKRIYWIEHWPVELGWSVISEDEYWLVEWDEEKNPGWEKIEDLDWLAESIGYPKEALLIKNFQLSESE
ncbi:MAG: hypothetical protein V3V05_10885 [Pontiella sp.]